MSYAQKHLIDGEQVQYETRLHWIVMLGHVVIAMVLVAVAVALVIAARSNWQSAEAMPPPNVLYIGALVCLVVGVIFFSIGLVRRGATEMAVTNKRVIIKTGLANRRTLELLLPRIESVLVEEPAMGRVLGYGSVTVRGTGGTPEAFHQIAHPLEFREQVQRQIAGETKV